MMIIRKLVSYGAPINFYIVIFKLVLESLKFSEVLRSNLGLWSWYACCNYNLLSSHLYIPTWVNSKFPMLGQGSDKKAKLYENNTSLQFLTEENEMSSTGSYKEKF